MLKFNEANLLLEQENGAALIPEVEQVVDEICEKGYKNLFYIGIGGTVLYANQMQCIVKEAGSALPLYVENAADFCLIGNPHFGKESVVIIESVSGDTKEVVAAVKKCKEAGAVIFGFVEKAGSPLYELCDHVVSKKGAFYYFWYTVTFRFMKNAGQYPEYNRLFAEIREFLPKALIETQKEADERAKEYAEKYGQEPITYLVGSGNLEDWAVCYGMCIMEEMQWMRTRPVSAANFFHGTLEVVEKDISVILMKGEDVTRPEAERAEAFLNRITDKLTVFDTRDYKVDGINPEFRGILAPMIMRSVFQRVSAHLEQVRKHPLEIRRYYRHLEY